MITRDKIVNYITNEIKKITSTCDIEINQPLIGIGLDSFTTIQLLVVIEDNYGISFTDDDLSFVNTTTINMLADIVEASVNRNRANHL